MSCKKCTYTSGMLRNSIIIERLSKVGDGIGGSTSTWLPIYTVGAKIDDKGGSEKYAADRIETTAVFEFIIRYIADITTKDRVNYGGRLFNIDRVENIEQRGQWMRVVGIQGVEE